MKKAFDPIKAVLKSYKKRDFDKTIQRSELLKRNTFFHQEYDSFRERVGYTFFKVKNLRTETIEKISPDNILLKLKYPIIDYTSPFKLNAYDMKKDRYWKESMNLDSVFYVKPTNLEQEIFNKNFVLEKYKDKWQEFCERWLIEAEWNGDFQTLEKYLRKPVEIYRNWDNSIRHSSLMIKINEWTTLDDIKPRWAEVEELQNKIWGKRERRANFSRDLIWYDLAKQHNLRPSQIATLWVKNYPEDIGLLVIRQFRKKEIDQADLGGKTLDDKELLAAVKNGFLSSKYKESFEKGFNYYVTGKIKDRNYSKYITTARPIVDVVQKAVKRMEKQIWEEMLPSGDSALFGFHPKRIT